jgi:bifunctional N-acetylglucosamine-1-phosphate-uridyltransferase/glucosamine-1-phosphate-acetyltransferase GlmU-like protein
MPILNDMTSIALVLAAGKGLRMKSDIPKPVIALNGKPMMEYIIDAFRNAGINEIAISVGHKSKLIKGAMGSLFTYIDLDMEEQECTHLVLSQLKDKMNWNGKDLFIFVGDTPLITKDTINYLHSYHHITNADCTILTTDLKKRPLYNKSLTERNDTLVRYVEDKNRSDDDIELAELFSSHFIFKADCLFALLDELQPELEKRHFSLTEILEIFFSKDFKVETLAIGEYEELADLNTQEDLVWAEEILNRRKFSKKTKADRKISGNRVIN